MDNKNERKIVVDINGKLYTGKDYIEILSKAIKEKDIKLIAGQAQYLIKEIQKKPSYFDDEIEFLNELKAFLYENFSFENAHELIKVIENFLK